MAKSIPITILQNAVVDDEDYEFLAIMSWRLHTNGYAINGQDQYMHRLVRHPMPGYQIDHIDGNKLNNRRENLRVVTKSQNQMNRGVPSDNTSGVKGVTLHKASGKWQAQIKVDGKYKYLGLFEDIQEAKAAYLEAQIKHFSGFARDYLTLIDEWIGA